jgi:hypothetical protein
MANQTLSTRDLIARLNNPTEAIEFISEGYRQGLNVSRWLEENSPSEPNSGLDAFERCLVELDIRTTSNPAAGYWASPASAFMSGAAARTLLSEFFARQWRKISYARPSHQERAIYLSTDGTPGSWQRPYSDAQQARWDTQLAPAIPISEVIGMTTPIEGQDYRAFYLTYNAEQLRKFRVGESADIPIAELADAERTIHLKKYGRGLRASYEQMRRMRVDKLALQIAYMAIQAEVDKLAAIINVMVNGDGNSGTTPTSYNLTAIDTGATAGTLTPKGWLGFKMKFANPYMVSGALMTEAIALELATLTFSANSPYTGYNAGGMVQGLNPINPVGNVTRYGWTSDAPANKILGFDRRFAIEQVTEIGGAISEMERFITNQTEVITMTEVEGYAVMDANATKLLVVNA